MNKWILNHIPLSPLQLRAEVLLECVRVAPVPWSKGTQAACDLGVSLNTTLTSELEDQRNMVDLKLVLRRYSLHMVKIEDPMISEVCVCVCVVWICFTGDDRYHCFVSIHFIFEINEGTGLWVVWYGMALVQALCDRCGVKLYIFSHWFVLLFADDPKKHCVT